MRVFDQADIIDAELWGRRQGGSGLIEYGKGIPNKGENLGRRQRGMKQPGALEELYIIPHGAIHVLNIGKWKNKR